jgi:hypothetical protein
LKSKKKSSKGINNFKPLPLPYHNIPKNLYSKRNS